MAKPFRVDGEARVSIPLAVLLSILSAAAVAGIGWNSIHDSVIKIDPLEQRVTRCEANYAAMSTDVAVVKNNVDWVRNYLEHQYDRNKGFYQQSSSSASTSPSQNPTTSTH